MSSSSDFVAECGIAPMDGLLVAWLPRLDSVMQEFYKDSCKVYAQDGIVIDMLDTYKPRVKWWRVREAARQLQMGIIEPAWSGAACNFTEGRLEEVRAMRGGKENGRFYNERLYMRAFSHGPWINLDEDENKRAAEAKLEELDERFAEPEGVVDEPNCEGTLSLQ